MKVFEKLDNIRSSNGKVTVHEKCQEDLTRTCSGLMGKPKTTCLIPELEGNLLTRPERHTWGGSPSALTTSLTVSQLAEQT